LRSLRLCGSIQRFKIIMPEEKKKSGLQKDISSIFAGLEDINNGRAEKPGAKNKPVSPPPGMLPPPSTGEKESQLKAALSAPSVPPRPTTTPGKLIMGGSFSRRRNAFLGLDIGSSSVKLIQLYPVSDGWEIGGYAIQEFQPGPGGGSLFENENFAKRLKELFSQTRAGKENVVCALRGNQVNTGLIQLSRMPKAELDSACRLEAGRRVTFNIDKALIRHTAVESETARPGGKLNYIVTSVSRETVSRILGFLREAGLQVAALPSLPFVWKDYINILPSPDANGAVAVVDISLTHTQVSIYKEDILHFSREFETGGTHITEAIIQAGQTFGVRDGISWKEAEEIKKTADLFQSNGTQTLKDTLTISQIAGMVRPVLEKIVKESKRSLEYYRQLYREEEVSRVYLCGGGALLTGFDKFFRERLRPPVKLIGISNRIRFHESLSSDETAQALFPRLARAVALSLSRRWEVNFVPPLDKILQNVLRRKILILVPVVALFIISFLFYRSKAALIPQQEKIVAIKQKQLDILKGELGPYKELSGLHTQLIAREKVGFYSSLRQPNWKGILKEFSRITPPTAILSEIISQEGEGLQRILCSGRVHDPDSSLHSGATQFIVEVENSPFFKDVEKISEDIDKGTFSFRCTLIY